MKKCTPKKLCKEHIKYKYIMVPNPLIRDDINESECKF